ncbi:MAG: hypothetical protein IIA61_08130 [Candidatus Marinimicrobia bacterium]|nr:hypothetical protein [Candidatus Neomarinimicrobiota bacterium]MCH8069500.1 hypothetical protein [Candidatus Neomarinimicrobiota bacterium]
MRKFNLIIFAIIFGITVGFSQAASVTNVTATQRTDGSKMVYITYDLAEETHLISLDKRSLRL